MIPDRVSAPRALQVPAFQSRWRLKGDRSHVFVVPYATRDCVWSYREGKQPNGRSWPTKRAPLADFLILHEPAPRAEPDHGSSSHGAS